MLQIVAAPQNTLGIREAVGLSIGTKDAMNVIFDVAAGFVQDSSA